MKDREQPTNPVKAIRAYCLDCAGDSPNEVKLCPCTDCALYPFRFGKNPYRKKRVLTEEQKARLVETLNKQRKENDDDDIDG
jgi:hypothetical protein